MFGMNMIVDLVLELSKDVANLTKNEIDDKAIKVIKLVKDGEYGDALTALAEIVDCIGITTEKEEKK